MKERPILFSGPMVRAILEGRKTVTRRALKAQPHGAGAWAQKGQQWLFPNVCPTTTVKCPYGQPGDRLWVRETWAEEHPLAVQEGRYFQLGRAGIPGPPGVTYHVIYRADGEPRQVWRRADHQHPYFTQEGPADSHAKKFPTSFSNYTRDGKGIYWNPSIHMPRWASRILLEITAVRVERLQDISNDQATAEGMESCAEDLDPDGIGYSSAELFSILWASTYSQESWHANPWVWVVEFRRVVP